MTPVTLPKAYAVSRMAAGGKSCRQKKQSSVFPNPNGQFSGWMCIHDDTGHKTEFEGQVLLCEECYERVNDGAKLIILPGSPCLGRLLMPRRRQRK